MGQTLAHTLGRRARLLLLLVLLALAAVLALWFAPLALLPLALAAALACWDRAALDHELRTLAAALNAESLDAKLEVTEGAFGELCHAVNRLQQQRRTRLQVEPMLPTLPVVRAARLADAGLPPEGVACEVAVLAIERGPGADRVAMLRETALRALRQAQSHEALMTRADGTILLIFGALQPQSPAASLRAAGEAARELHKSLSGDGRLRLALASGTARAVVLPGLGLTIVGGPVEQALGLRNTEQTPLLLCNEDAYLGLRRIGAIAPQLAASRLAVSDDRPVYAVNL